VYVGSHNFVGGRANCAPFPPSRPGFRNARPPAMPFRFAHLQQLARQTRGMSGVGFGDLAPGSPCYDGSYESGLIHCASLTDVIISAFTPGAAPMTTDCSDAEQACLNPLPTITPPGGPGLPVGYNSQTGTVAGSNTTGATQPGTPASIACPSGYTMGPGGTCYIPQCPTGFAVNASGQCVSSDACQNVIGIPCSTVFIGAAIAAVALGALAILGGHR
jgi:hypothetical protein